MPHVRAHAADRDRVRGSGRWAGVVLVLLAVGLARPAGAPTAGAASTSTVWVDPVRGRDSASGRTASTALRTLDAAWRRIPRARTLQRPVRILVRSGTIAATAAPNYWEQRWGTASAPISIVSVDGPGRAQLPPINMFGVRHLTMDGVAIRSQFDAFHCERCSHIELRRSAFVGIGDPQLGLGPQEAVKLNQSDHIRIVDSYLAGATDNALDLVAVQDAYVARNTIAHAADWCAYAKGGSTAIRFEANHVHHCGTGGITIGQGTGLQFMQAPWTRYEAYGSAVTNTVLHDIDGAALGVSGGFAVLLAHNTGHRIGSRDHLLGVTFGERSCDGTGEDDAACAAIRAGGGWGPSAAGGDPAPIGNSQVAVYHNLLHNPDGVASAWTHFAVYAPRPAGDSGGPDPAVADDALRIVGNAVRNGPDEHDLGLGGEQGCLDEHPTCSPDAVRIQNAINPAELPVRLVAGVVPVPDGEVPGGGGAAAALPAFDFSASGVPAVTMPATVARDRAGRLRADLPWQPGAYAGDAPTSAVRLGVTGRGTLAVRAGASFGPAGGVATVLRGDWVQLSARAAAGKRFLGWTGDCAGQRGSTCLLRAGAASHAAGARFG